MADAPKVTSNGRLTVGLFAAIGALLMVAALLVESDTVGRLLLAALGLVALFTGFDLVRQRRAGRTRRNRWDGRSREQWLVGFLVSGAMLGPVWFFGPPHPDLLFAGLFGVTAVCASLASDAIAQRWPSGGVPSLFHSRGRP